MAERNQQQADHDAQRMQLNRAELVERIAGAITEDGGIQPFQGLDLFRHSTPIGPNHVTSKPSFCVIAQGSKEMFLGDSYYRYDPFHYLLATLELPNVSRIQDATEECPYLALRLELTPALVGSVMVETGYALPARPTGLRAINVSTLDVHLLDAVVRLIRLLDSPADAPVLMPMIAREIVYRLLMSDQGGRLRNLAILGGFTTDIAKAVQQIRQKFDQPLDIEQLAQELGMSVSAFHHHFKAVTAMSPLQYQKRLRLQEARRLMLGEDLDATSAAYRVGYNDASHFNREYKSVFGAPPMRDVQQLRDATARTW